MSRQSHCRWNVAAIVLVGLVGFTLRTLSAQREPPRHSSAVSKPLHGRRDAALPIAGTLLQEILK